MQPDTVLLTALGVAALLAVAGLLVRDVRVTALGAALVVTAGVSVPGGALLVGLTGPSLVQTRRRRRIAAVSLAIGLPLAVALSLTAAAAPDTLPVPGSDGVISVALRGLGMAGLAYGGVHALRVWRRSARYRDLAVAVGFPLLGLSLVSGEAAAWRAPDGAWEQPVAAAAILLLMSAAVLDTWAVAVGGRGHAESDDPYVAAVERRLGVELRGMLATAARRDPRAGGHSRRVAALSVRVADRMGLSTRMQGQAAAAGLLHHLGAARRAAADQTAAADGLLVALEPPLSNEVREAVRDRATHLAALEERYMEWSSTVPIVTRILAVCDAFETRTGEAGQTPSAVVAALRAEAGERYCPAALEALEAVLEGGLHDVEPVADAPVGRRRGRPRAAAGDQPEREAR